MKKQRDIIEYKQKPGNGLNVKKISRLASSIIDSPKDNYGSTCENEYGKINNLLRKDGSVRTFHNNSNGCLFEEV